MSQMLPSTSKRMILWISLPEYAGFPQNNYAGAFLFRHSFLTLLETANLPVGEVTWTGPLNSFLMELTIDEPSAVCKIATGLCEPVGLTVGLKVMVFDESEMIWRFLFPLKRMGDCADPEHNEVQELKPSLQKLDFTYKQLIDATCAHIFGQ